jgi:hypothetical protein
MRYMRNFSYSPFHRLVTLVNAYVNKLKIFTLNSLRSDLRNRFTTVEPLITDTLINEHLQ